MKTLLLWLEAPLQSWGADSRFGRRETLPFPTRSGVLGLLCSAMGRGGEQEEWLARMRPCSQTVLAFPRQRRGKAQNAPLLRDFHMVGSGYDDKDPWQNMMVPKKSDGNKPNGPGSKITHRFYLQDMAFACLLEIPEDMETEVEGALQAPVWPICLGRKSCIPSVPVYRGFHESAEAAEACALEIAKRCGRICTMKVIEGKDLQGEWITLADVPLRFGQHKRYAERYVSILRI